MKIPYSNKLFIVSFYVSNHPINLWRLIDLGSKQNKIKEKFETNIINNAIPRLVRHQLIIFGIAKNRKNLYKSPHSYTWFK
jgi:hypothetical protein